MRTTWIVICGMRRSGTALRYEIVKEIMGGYSHGWISWQEFSDLFRRIDGKDRYAIIKSHVFLPSHCPVASQVFKEKRMWGVHSHRDLRDVAASILNFSDGPFCVAEMEKILLATMKEVDSWMSVARVHVSSYEEMMLHPATGICGIADFLDRAVDCEAIAEKFSIERNRERLPVEYRTEDSVWWHNHIDTGEIGRWKSELSPEYVGMIDRIGSDWQRKMGYL